MTEVMTIETAGATGVPPGFGDDELIQILSDRCRDVAKKKARYELGRADGDSDYLERAVARLAYFLAREEYYALVTEASGRGLL